MKFFEKLLSESSEVSCMRLMAIISLIVGAGIAIYCVLAYKDLPQVTPLVSIFVGAAFSGKTIQKFMETKNGQ